MTSLQLSQQEAAAELLRRRKARADLGAYALAIDIPGKPVDEEDEDAWLFRPIETSVAAHHFLLLQELQRVSETPYGRLMVLMPPGSAKSTYASVVFPPWYMGRQPDRRVILTSYGSDLARRHGRRARQIARSHKHSSIFRAALSPETSAADEWALTNGSEYLAGGILSGITGNRAHGLLIDDPVKGREEADSKLIRDKTKAAYQDDLKTRLIPGGWIVLIQTRWNEDDLAGSILPEGYEGQSGDILCRDGQVWRVLCLPAKAERGDDPLGRRIGEYLWQEWFDRKHWSQFENQPRTWSALYQQRPAPEEGDFFRAEWLRPYTQAPARSTLRIYGGSDYAVTADGGDYTVHGVIGVDPNDDLWLLDVWRRQASSDQWVEAFCDMVCDWRPIGWAEESGQIKAGVGPFLEKRMREREAFVFRETFPTRGDKAIRAQSIRGRMAMKGLYVPVNAPWYEAFRSELLTFPAGHDDQVDMLGLIGQLLDKMLKGRPEKAPEPQKKLPPGAVVLPAPPSVGSKKRMAV
jgi:predicted phage terminase large subunit-like protein